MYPNQYFSLFPPFPRENRVFVAMSFDEQFSARWEEVIVPAIRSTKYEGGPLEPHRVDAKRISDSILTEILGGISNDQLVLADVTAADEIDGKPVRNGNVMYEVGIAHAIRLPEEVLLFRSDTSHLLFDISNVRVNSYDPDGDHVVARELVAEAIRDAFKERDLRCQNSIKLAAKSLDIPSLKVLVNALAIGNGSIRHLPTKNVKNALGNAPGNAAIGRLLGMGALQARFAGLSEKLTADMDDSEILSYELTPFGRALTKYVLSEALDIPGVPDNLAERLASRLGVQNP